MPTSTEIWPQIIGHVFSDLGITIGHLHQNLHQNLSNLTTFWEFDGINVLRKITFTSSFVENN